MILFQIMYRKSPEEAKADLARMDELIKSGGTGSMSGDSADMQKTKFVEFVWPEKFVEQFKNLGMFYDDANRVWNARVSGDDAKLLLKWFYKDWRPWATSLSGDRGEFAKRLLAHAVDFSAAQGVIEGEGLESL